MKTQEQIKQERREEAGRISRAIPGEPGEEIARLNADAMCAVMMKTGALIRPTDYSKWRPTVPTTGDIPGLPCTVTILATDGNLAIFEPTTGEGHGLGSSFIGHIHRFSGKVEPLHSLPPPVKYGTNGEPKKKRKVDPKKARIKAILQDLTDNF